MSEGREGDPTDPEEGSRIRRWLANADALLRGSSAGKKASIEGQDERSRSPGDEEEPRRHSQ